MNNNYDKAIRINSFLWNAIGAGFSAIQSAILLLFASRLFSIETQSAITIAYTLSNIFLAIAKYGLRNFQASDETEEYSLYDYLNTRIVTTTIALIICLVYVLFMYKSGRYVYNRIIVIILISIMKLTESIEDVYIGRLQQIGRLDIGAKYFSIHIIVESIIICISMIISKNINTSLILGVIVSAFFVLLFITKYNNNYSQNNNIINKKTIIDLLKKGFPLCLSMVLYLFFGNLPKYLSDIYLTDYQQVLIGYLMLPMFVVLLLNNFIMQPLVKPLAEKWHNDKISFNKMIKKQIIIIVLISISYLFVSLYIILPMLSYLYKIDLSSYKNIYVLLCVGVMFYTTSYYLTTILTIMRKQKSVLYGYLIGLIVLLALTKSIMNAYGIMGTAIIYIISNISITFFYLLICFKTLNITKI